MNPLVFALGTGSFTIFLIIVLIALGVPGGVAGMITFFTILFGSMALSKTVFKKKNNIARRSRTK